MKIISEHPKIKQLESVVTFNHYINRFSGKELRAFQEEFPDLIMISEPENENDPNYELISINLISKSALPDGGFRKIRFYLDYEGKILRILDSNAK